MKILENLGAIRLHHQRTKKNKIRKTTSREYISQQLLSRLRIYYVRNDVIENNERTFFKFGNWLLNVKDQPDSCGTVLNNIVKKYQITRENIEIAIFLYQALFSKAIDLAWERRVFSWDITMLISLGMTSWTRYYQWR